MHDEDEIETLAAQRSHPSMVGVNKVRPCAECGELTFGSIGAAGIRWPCLCQPCKDEADNALCAQVKAQAGALSAVHGALSKPKETRFPCGCVARGSAVVESCYMHQAWDEGINRAAADYRKRFPWLQLGTD